MSVCFIFTLRSLTSCAAPTMRPFKCRCCQPTQSNYNRSLGPAPPSPIPSPCRFYPQCLLGPSCSFAVYAEFDIQLDPLTLSECSRSYCTCKSVCVCVLLANRERSTCQEAVISITSLSGGSVQNFLIFPGHHSWKGK